MLSVVVFGAGPAQGRHWALFVQRSDEPFGTIHEIVSVGPSETGCCYYSSTPYLILETGLRSVDMVILLGHFDDDYLPSVEDVLSAYPVYPLQGSIDSVKTPACHAWTEAMVLALEDNEVLEKGSAEKLKGLPRFQTGALGCSSPACPVICILELINAVADEPKQLGEPIQFT
jgi:hypothetical protein